MTALLRYGVKVTRTEAEAVDAAAEVLNAAGIAFTLTRGGKHVAITADESGHKIVFASSPRTDNHRDWARQSARRLVRWARGEERGR